MLRGNLGPERKTSGRVVRYEGNLRWTVRVSRKASEQQVPSSEVRKDEGSMVLSIPAGNVHLGEQGVYMRNWLGSCLVLAKTSDKMYWSTYQSFG